MLDRTIFINTQYIWCAVLQYIPKHNEKNHSYEVQEVINKQKQCHATGRMWKTKYKKKSIGKERLALRITMHFTATMSRVPTKYMTANNDHTHMCTWLTLWLAQLDPTMGGLVILSNSSWNDETLALPGEGATKLAGVGGCELTPSYNEHTHHHVYVYLPLLQPTQSTFISPDFMSDFTFPLFSLLPSYFGHSYLSIIKHYFFLIKKKEVQPSFFQNDETLKMKKKIRKYLEI